MINYIVPVDPGFCPAASDIRRFNNANKGSSISYGIGLWNKLGGMMSFEGKIFILGELNLFQHIFVIRRNHKVSKYFGNLHCSTLEKIKRICMWIRPVNFINTRIFHQPTCCLFLMARALALLQQMSGKKWHDYITMIEMRQAERNQWCASLIFVYLSRYLLKSVSANVSIFTQQLPIFEPIYQYLSYNKNAYIYIYINKDICKQY